MKTRVRWTRRSIRLDFVDYVFHMFSTGIRGQDHGGLHSAPGPTVGASTTDFQSVVESTLHVIVLHMISQHLPRAWSDALGLARLGSVPLITRARRAQIIEQPGKRTTAHVAANERRPIAAAGGFEGKWRMHGPWLTG